MAHLSPLRRSHLTGFLSTLDALMRLQRARQRTSPDPKPLVAAAGSEAPLSRQSGSPSLPNAPRKAAIRGTVRFWDSVRSQNSPTADALSERRTDEGHNRELGRP